MRRLRIFSVLLLILTTSCASLMGSATANLSTSVSTAILNEDDPALVREGAPAYLLMMDGMLRRDPDDVDLLLAAARLYGAYAGAFAEGEERARRFASRARDYALRAICLRLPPLCGTLSGPFAPYEEALARTGPKDLPVLFGLASAWATWIQTHTDDWNAIADLPRVERMLERVTNLDDRYDGGTPHLYLGVLHTLRPAHLGGRPEQGRRHFERALELSRGRNLMAKTLLAKHYARLVFDRELHDRVLAEVLAADPHAEDLTLSNVLAQQAARQLLDSADDYF
jgi:hypothetical protein